MQVEVEGMQGLSELVEHIPVWVTIFGKHPSQLDGIKQYPIAGSDMGDSQRLLLVRKSQ